jgi:hypothetical protein
MGIFSKDLFRYEQRGSQKKEDFPEAELNP